MNRSSERVPSKGPRQCSEATAASEESTGAGAVDIEAPISEPPARTTSLTALVAMLFLLLAFSTDLIEGITATIDPDWARETRDFRES